MSERREQAQKHGFTEMIDCGVVTLHVFHEDSLYQNLPLNTGAVIGLADIASFENERIPLLKCSRIEILPSKDGRDANFHGYVVFDIPTTWATGQQPAFRHQISKLQRYLENVAGFFGTEKFKQEEDSLAMRSEGRKDARISLERLDHTTACATITAPVDEMKSQSLLYDDLVSYIRLWGEVHGFIARSSELPYKQPADSRWTTVYVGSTPETTVSEVELAIESQIGERKIVNRNAPYLGWAEDVNSSIIEAFHRNLPGSCDIDATAEAIVRTKHELTRQVGSPVYITQQDIIEALAQHIKRPENR